MNPAGRQSSRGGSEPQSQGQKLSTKAHRASTAAKAASGGMSQRQAAKVLGVSHTTVQADLADNPPNGVEKSTKTVEKSTASRTGSAKTKAHRADTAAKAASGGVSSETRARRALVFLKTGPLLGKTGYGAYPVSVSMPWTAFQAF